MCQFKHAMCFLCFIENDMGLNDQEYTGVSSAGVFFHLNIKTKLQLHWQLCEMS